MPLGYMFLPEEKKDNFYKLFEDIKIIGIFQHISHLRYYFTKWGKISFSILVIKFLLEFSLYRNAF